MQIKTLLLLSVAAMLACNLYAQDKIYKRDGDVIEAKVISVGVKNITFARFDNPSGPEYVVAKDAVEKIVYQNGSEDVFEAKGRGRSDLMPREIPDMPHRPSLRPRPHLTVDSNMQYHANLLALAPVQFTENGIGFSLSYERALDKSGIVAFYLPVIATFNLNNGTYYDNNTQSMKNGHADAMYYAMPCLKLYPVGCFGRIRYAIGPSLVLATGQRSSPTYDPSGNTTYLIQTHSMLGVMLTNSLNINPTAHVYIGLEFGGGFTYLNRIGGLNQSTAGLFEGGIRVGYRF